MVYGLVHGTWYMVWCDILKCVAYGSGEAIGVALVVAADNIYRREIRKPQV